MRYFVFELDGICYVGNSREDSQFLDLAMFYSDSYAECEHFAKEWTTAPTFILDFNY